MTIAVKFFAGMRERIGEAGCELDYIPDQTVADIWQRVAGEALTGNVFTAVNQQYVDAETVVNDHDEVAFFPPVTGG